MAHSLSWKANSCSSSRHILWLFWNRRLCTVSTAARERPYPEPDESISHPSDFLKWKIKIAFQSTPRSSHSSRATFPTHLALLDLIPLRSNNPQRTRVLAHPDCALRTTSIQRNSGLSLVCLFPRCELMSNAAGSKCISSVDQLRSAFTKLRKIAFHWSLILKYFRFYVRSSVPLLPSFPMSVSSFLSTASFSSQCFMEKKLVYARRSETGICMGFTICYGIERWRHFRSGSPSVSASGSPVTQYNRPSQLKAN